MNYHKDRASDDSLSRREENDKTWNENLTLEQIYNKPEKYYGIFNQIIFANCDNF